MGYKNAIINALSYLPLGFLFKPFYSGEGTILFFHKVVKDKKNGPRIPLMAANEIEAGYLEKIIVHLRKKGYDIISLDAMNKRLSGFEKKDKKFVVFTFDDGYKDNLTLAYPIFKKYGVPFSIYVTNCFPNHTAQLWWYLLEDIVLENTEVSFLLGEEQKRYSSVTQREKEHTFEGIRNLLIKASPKQQQQLTHQLAEKYDKDLPGYVSRESLDWEEIKELSQDPLVDIGGHTMNHITLNKVAPEV
ncbi:MAG: polysaccharide deacetylase family protein, partial [Bacteroidota bacterium]